MRSKRLWISAFAVFAVACGGDDDGAPSDAPTDAPAACVDFTGEFVNWLSTEAEFCGVQNATWTVRDDASQKVTTPPNGRITLCVPQKPQVVVDIAPPAAPSGCLVSDTTPYPRTGVAIASAAVIAAGGQFSARAMTQQQEDAMFAQVGQAYAASAAQLVVHVQGTVHPVSISASHAPAQQFTGSQWQAATDPNAPSGTDVFFPNVAPGSVDISAQGDATGTGPVTLEAGKYTYVELIGR